ncbi:MAG: iron-sulfur protein [Firmicutes bacterium]|nr:iron-sulfur protein [Bacillota bacterium]
MHMNLLAIIGSPKGKNSNSEHLLQAFLRGAEEAGAQTETVYLKDKKINHCNGCFSCWAQTPGKCVHEDDMSELIQKLRYADILVMATPLYVYTVPGLMKDFMDRTLPISLPYVYKYGDRYVHPGRYEDQHRTKVILISNCGLPTRQYFSGLQETFRLWCSGPDRVMAGSILCSAGPLLGIEQARPYIQWYLDACEKAGKEIVSSGNMTDETQAILQRELLDDTEAYVNNGNAFYEQLLHEKMPDMSKWTDK